MTLATEWKMNSRGRSGSHWHLCRGPDGRCCHQGSSSGEGENLVCAELIAFADGLAVGRAGQRGTEDES